jgi:ParB family chromosome partitioning protein
MAAPPVQVATPPADSTAAEESAEPKPSGQPDQSANQPVPSEIAAQSDFQSLPVDQIEPNRQQPRQHFDKAALGELAESIRRAGLMQPVVVRKQGSGRYELIAGERRWRAAQLAGLTEIPAYLRDVDDQQAAEWALIENLQREDLNPIERAEAFRRLAEGYGLKHEEVAERVSLDRSTVTNLLRLLKLAPPVREMVSRGTLSMGQSRALAGVEDHDDQQRLAERAVREGWSVRQVEAAVKSLAQGANPQGRPAEKAARAAYLDDLERQIAEQLSTKVQLKTGRKKGSGTLSIEFYSIDQFDDLLGKLGVETG